MSRRDANQTKAVRAKYEGYWPVCTGRRCCLQTVELTLKALEDISVAFAGDIHRTCQPDHESRNAIPGAGAIMAEMEKAGGEEQRRC